MTTETVLITLTKEVFRYRDDEGVPTCRHRHNRCEFMLMLAVDKFGCDALGRATLGVGAFDECVSPLVNCPIWKEDL